MADDRPRSETILAIPTEFDGRRFRSRTEARWACFFKALGLDYEYEPEGFQLSDGTFYLPDFFLPAVRFWAECKPSFLTHFEEGKCRLLASGTGFPCLWLIGTPDFKGYRGATWDCGEYTVCEYSLDIEEYGKAFKRERRLWSHPYYSSPPCEAEFSDAYKHAFYAARGYRFEGQ